MLCSARVSGSTAVSIVRFSAPTFRRLSGCRQNVKEFLCNIGRVRINRMGPYVDSVTSDEAIPATTSVVVIGGGIIGTFAALTLAGRGIPVVLCEKGYIACEQSSRNWGWCRQAGRDEREMPLIIESLRLWRDMNRLTESETGFRTCGVMYVGETETDEARFATLGEVAKPYTIVIRIVRGADLASLMPGATRAYACG